MHEMETTMEVRERDNAHHYECFQPFPNECNLKLNSRHTSELCKNDLHTSLTEVEVFKRAPIAM